MKELGSNEKKIYDKIISPLYRKYKAGNFVNIRGGIKTTELVNITVSLVPTPILHFHGKVTNVIYCRKELEWYESMSRSIIGYVDDVAIWKQVSSKDGMVNSNYGWCAFSYENYGQFANCLKELLYDKYSRRACMIYTRPSIWEDYNVNGMSDYICTQNTQFLIRDNKLHMIVNMRSNDFIFGFFNDFYWQCHVYEKMMEKLLEKYNLDTGEIYWNTASMHVYERHFKLLEKIYKENKNG